MKLYVGTYAKYNKGSLYGKWFDLDKYKNAEEFEAACRKFHSDERDPEFMFQDVETDPGCDWQRGLYSESSIPRDYWRLKAENEKREREERKAEKPSARSEREEQDRLCEEYTRIDRGPDRDPKRFKYWYDYYRKEYHFVKLSDGTIARIEKPGIETRFCCGEDDRGQGGEGPGTIAYANKVLAEKKTERGFKETNLRRFDKNTILQFGRKPWRRAQRAAKGERVDWICGRYDFVPCICTGLYKDGRRYIGDANGNRCGSVVSYISDDDFRKIRAAYMKVRTRFKKRLDAWWKRFGADHIHTWTYWTEA